jgi:hypothetical protein
MRDKPSAIRDMVLGALVLLPLALPFLPVPGDGVARMKVHFRTATMAQPHHFSTATSRSTCAIMAAALTYEDPDTGEYTRVACSE